MFFVTKLKCACKNTILKFTCWIKTTIEMIFWAEVQASAEMAKKGQDQLSLIMDEFGLSLAKFTVLNAHRPTIDSALSGPGQVLDVTT